MNSVLGKSLQQVRTGKDLTSINFSVSKAKPSIPINYTCKICNFCAPSGNRDFGDITPGS